LWGVGHPSLNFWGVRTATTPPTLRRCLSQSSRGHADAIKNCLLGRSVCHLPQFMSSTFSCHRDGSISSELQSNRPAFSLRATQRVTHYDVIRHHFALTVDRRCVYPSRSQLWIPRERNGMGNRHFEMLKYLLRPRDVQHVARPSGD